jgi:RNA polymerase subunit RPABC4/transcription elongation factor Spt4
MKKCNKCGKTDLSWNKEWFKYSNKWQLTNHKNDDGEWCVNNLIKPKGSKITKKDYTICPLCSESDFGYLLNYEYVEHMELHHPNNEARTNEYFQVN